MIFDILFKQVILLILITQILVLKKYNFNIFINTLYRTFKTLTRFLSNI
jgi:hypothetical protein